MKQATNAERIGVVLTGFEVPHVHLHLVPLHEPDELFKEASKKELEEMKRRIKESLG